MLKTTTAISLSFSLSVATTTTQPVGIVTTTAPADSWVLESTQPASPVRVTQPLQNLGVESDVGIKLQPTPLETQENMSVDEASAACVREGQVVFGDDGLYYVDPACVEERRNQEKDSVDAVPRCPGVGEFVGAGIYCLGGSNLHFCQRPSQRNAPKIKTCSNGCRRFASMNAPDTCKPQVVPMVDEPQCWAYNECTSCTAALGCVWNGAQCHFSTQRPRCPIWQGCANLPGECPAESSAASPQLSVYPQYYPRYGQYPTPFQPSISPFSAYDFMNVYGATLRPNPLAFGPRAVPEDATPSIL